MKIGLSLSNCVRDLLDGKINIEDVQCIIAGTCIKDGNWNDLVKIYSESYWYKYMEKDIWAVMEQLIPIIYQPRLVEKPAPNISKGYWIDLNKDVYISR